MSSGADADEVRVRRCGEEIGLGQRLRVVVDVGVAVFAKGIDGALVYAFEQQDFDLRLIE